MSTYNFNVTINSEGNDEDRARQCYNCGKPGHYSRDCAKPRGRRGGDGGSSRDANRWRGGRMGRDGGRRRGGGSFHRPRSRSPVGSAPSIHTRQPWSRGGVRKTASPRPLKDRSDRTIVRRPSNEASLSRAAQPTADVLPPNERRVTLNEAPPPKEEMSDASEQAESRTESNERCSIN